MKVLLSLAFLYILYAFLFFLFQRKLIYPVSFIPDYPLNVENQSFEKHFIKHENSNVEAWYFPAINNAGGKSPLLIVAHGNATLIDYWLDFLETPLQMGLAVLLVEYPGYGRSAGSPSQKSITDVFEKAYDIFSKKAEIDSERIIYLGRSLGGGVVCSLARERMPAAIILNSTFTSVKSFAAGYGLPGFLARDPYNNDEFLKSYSGPLMLIHGRMDATIPFAHAQKLHAIRPDAHFIEYNSDHNNTPPDWDDFWKKVQGFLIQYRLIKQER